MDKTNPAQEVDYQAYGSALAEFVVRELLTSHRQPPTADRVDLSRTSDVSGTWQSELKSDGRGGYQSTHKLNGTEIESWRISTSDGRLRMEPLRCPDPVPDAQGLDKARSSLLDAVFSADFGGGDAKKLTAAKLDFIRDMTHLEHRARSGELGMDAVKVRTELAETYRQMERLFKGPQTADVSQAHRVIAARQLASELADPTSIDQGMASHACRMTGAQCRLAAVRPSVVAKVVADGLVDGKVRYGTPPIEISLDVRSRTPASNHCLEVPVKQNERSFSSQIFQLASMNLMGRDPVVVREHLHYMKKWNENLDVKPYARLEFTQGAEGARHRKMDNQGKQTEELHLKDNGLMVYGVTADGKREPLTQPGVKRFGQNQILLQACSSQKLLDLLDPGKHEGTVVSFAGLVEYTRTNISGERPGDLRGMRVFGNENELVAMLEDAKRKRAFPLIVASRDTEPDPGESEGEKLADDECNHDLIIRDVIVQQGPGGQKIYHVAVDDFFGRQHDYARMSIPDLKKRLGMK